METNFSKAKILMVTAVMVAVFISPTTFVSFAKGQVGFGSEYIWVYVNSRAQDKTKL
jgi:hypothetical protein